METRKKARRVYTEEFRAEAVRMMNDRRREGITLAQIGRELDLEPDVLRKWARQLGAWTPDLHVPRPEPSRPTWSSSAKSAGCDARWRCCARSGSS